MASVTEDPDAYQSLSDLRGRVPYDGPELFDDNEHLRFDELLVELEEEARGIFETLWGDETPTEETGRVDELRATDDAALLLTYPVNDVTQVEVKRSGGGDWEVYESDRWTFTDHRLILEGRPRGTRHRRTQGRNRLVDESTRATWRDVAVAVRVTYDRGWSSVPADIKNLQGQLVTRMIRKRRLEDGFAAASPDELQGVSPDFDTVLTEDLRQRIMDVTTPGGATMSI